MYDVTKNQHLTVLFIIYKPIYAIACVGYCEFECYKFYFFKFTSFAENFKNTYTNFNRQKSSSSIAVNLDLPAFRIFAPPQKKMKFRFIS